MVSIWSWILLSSLVTYSSCVNKAYLEERIVNGNPISASEYPWMISMRYEFEVGRSLFTSSHFCGASLIETDPITILTAAHCVDGFYTNYNDDIIYPTNTSEYGDIKINIACDLNRTYASDYSQPTNITSSLSKATPYNTLYITSYSEIYIHPQYGQSEFGIIDGYDIALLIIQNEDNMNETDISPLPTIPGPYSSSQSCCISNEELIQIGYGLNETNGSLTETLESTTMDYITGSQCYNEFIAAGNDSLIGILATYLYYDEQEIPNRFVCAKEPGTDACQGDSGGPLFRMKQDIPEIVGIVSFGEGCAHKNEYPGFWTSTGHFHTWIKNTINPTPSPTKMSTDGVFNIDTKYLNMVVLSLLIYIL